jgi:hypothetical protein
LKHILHVRISAFIARKVAKNIAQSFKKSYK